MRKHNKTIIYIKNWKKMNNKYCDVCSYFCDIPIHLMIFYPATKL